MEVLRAGRAIESGKYWRTCTQDAEARELLLASWRGCEGQAFFWETPALSHTSAERGFEFIMNPAPTLATMAPEPLAFAKYFSDQSDVVSFANLGGDAQLLVPCPRAEPRVYAHLAAFARGAPLAQQHELVTQTARALIQRMGTAPVWTSTSGLGVAWVHVRLDTRPKYYTHRNYAQTA